MMPAVCLMLLLPDELLTKIIIHSIKDEPTFHFLNLRNQIYDTFRRICNSDEVLLHVSLRDLREACKNRYVKLCFERRFREANHSDALCFEGMERLMRRQNPDKGLKLIGDASTEDSGAKYFLAILKYRCNSADPNKGLKLIGDAAAENSSAKYFLSTLKYRCNSADPEAMALLQEISGGPSPHDD
jgi:hypothetical protein